MKPPARSFVLTSELTSGIDATGLQSSFYSLEVVQALVHQLAMVRLKMNLQFAWPHTFMTQNLGATAAPWESQPGAEHIKTPPM